jgi:hypothetical protein
MTHILSNVGVPASANAHVKYTSKSSFGAVVIASKPVTMTGYYDERLFLAWLSANKEALASTYGNQLRKYGMWIVTQTHTTPSCWINAWQDKSREAIISFKAKANMMGGVGEDLDLDDQSSDRDWTHYTAKEGEGVVAFMDGIEVKRFDWYIEDFKQSIRFPRSSVRTRMSSSSRGASMPAPLARSAAQASGASRQYTGARNHPALSPTAVASTAAARRASYTPSRPDKGARNESCYSPFEPSQNLQDRRFSSTHRSLSAQRQSHRASPILSPNETLLLPRSDAQDVQSPTHEQTLLDIGINHSLSRSFSTASHNSSVRTSSLSKEGRTSISYADDKDKRWSLAAANYDIIQR